MQTVQEANEDSASKSSGGTSPSPPPPMPTAGSATFRLTEGATFALPDGCVVTVREGALETSDGQTIPIPKEGSSVTIERRVPKPDGRTALVRHTIRLGGETASKGTTEKTASGPATPDEAHGASEAAKEKDSIVSVIGQDKSQDIFPDQSKDTTSDAISADALAVANDVSDSSVKDQPAPALETNEDQTISSLSEIAGPPIPQPEDSKPKDSEQSNQAPISVPEDFKAVHSASSPPDSEHDSSVPNSSINQSYDPVNVASSGYNRTTDIPSESKEIYGANESRESSISDDTPQTKPFDRHHDSLQLITGVPRLSDPNTQVANTHRNGPKTPERKSRKQIKEPQSIKQEDEAMRTKLNSILNRLGYGVPASTEGSDHGGSSNPPSVSSETSKETNDPQEGPEVPEPVSVPKVISYFESITPTRSLSPVERRKLPRDERSPSAGRKPRYGGSPEPSGTSPDIPGSPVPNELKYSPSPISTDIDSKTSVPPSQDKEETGLPSIAMQPSEGPTSPDTSKHTSRGASPRKVSFAQPVARDGSTNSEPEEMEDIPIPRREDPTPQARLNRQNSLDDDQSDNTISPKGVITIEPISLVNSQPTKTATSPQEQVELTTAIITQPTRLKTIPVKNSPAETDDCAEKTSKGPEMHRSVSTVSTDSRDMLDLSEALLIDPDKVPGHEPYHISEKTNEIPKSPDSSASMGEASITPADSKIQEETPSAAAEEERRPSDGITQAKSASQPLINGSTEHTAPFPYAPPPEEEFGQTVQDSTITEEIDEELRSRPTDPFLPDKSPGTAFNTKPPTMFEECITCLCCCWCP